MPPEYLPSAGSRQSVLVNKAASSIETHAGSFLGLALDRSDSMARLAGTAVESVNRLIEEQRAAHLAGPCLEGSRLSLLLFNNKIETVRDAVPLSEVTPLDRLQYRPSGGTALNDAVAKLIKGIGAAGGRRSRVLCVIVTDGEENSSKEFRSAARSEKWSFIDD